MWDFQEQILYIANKFINLCDFCRADFARSTQAEYYAVRNCQKLWIIFPSYMYFPVVNQITKLNENLLSFMVHLLFHFMSF